MAGLMPKVDYGVDASNVIRNLFAIGALCLVLTFVLPAQLHLGRVIFCHGRCFGRPAS